MADKIIGLDLSKRDGFNKAITGRVGDKNNTYLFRLFNNGVLFDLTKATQIAMLGLTPSGYYVDAVGFPQADGTIKVDIPSAFNAEVGYFQRCFIRVVTTDEEILSTQDLIYYSYGNADISAGGGKDYIGRVEELIKELNNAADNFTNGLMDKYNKALADLQDLTGKMDSLDARMDALEVGGALMKTEANALYMNIRSTPIKNNDWNTLTAVGTYSVEGAIGANAPANNVWGTLLVQSKKHNDDMLTQFFVGDQSTYYRRKQGSTTWSAWIKLGNAADFYTKKETYSATEIDDKLANVKPTVATGAEVNLGTDNNKTITPKALADSTYTKYAEVETIVNAMHRDEYIFGVGTNITPVTSSGTIIPIGDIVSKDILSGASDSLTLQSDGTIKFNKNMTVLITGGATLVVGDTSPTDYIYLDLGITNQTSVNFIAQGAVTNGTLRLTWSAMGLRTATVKAGDIMTIKASMRASKQAFSAQLTALSIREVKGV